MSALSPHLDVEQVADLAEGLLDPAAADAARAHLESCPDCREIRDRLSRVQGLLAAEGTQRLHMPAEVAERIDAALAAQRPLADSSRPPSRWPRVLVAAASVAVVGAAVTYGLDQPGGSGSDDAATSAGQAGPVPGAGTQERGVPGSPPSSREGGAVDPQALTLDRDNLAASVRQAVRTADRPVKLSGSDRGFGGDPCVERALRPRERAGASLYPARLEGDPVKLVVQPKRVPARMAYVVDCTERPRVVGTASLP